MAAAEHFDVLIIGAGISGIGAAYRVKTRCPKKTFAILEGRTAIGGTWDLFRYPGIRSDSDMYTLGFPWSPWNGEKTVADGKDIREYIERTAREHDLDEKIRFGHRVERATWSSDAARWTLEVVRASDGERFELTCNFVFMCTGYYDYAGGYLPEFAGKDRYRGRLVHPQHWPADLDYAGKRVVVIGSGATAVGLVPQMANDAAHVTMLQRSPTYMIAMPGKSPVGAFFEDKLPPSVARHAERAFGITMTKVIWTLARTWPERAKRALIGQVKMRITREDFDWRTHFTPRYKPWDQRLCLVRDGDLFEKINEGKVDVVTDIIETFTEKGIRLASGRELEADVVVAATGLNMQLLGGVPLVVDGHPVKMSERTMYKATMLNDVPNLALSLGYINASWTIRADMVAKCVCRLLNEMDRKGRRTVVARFRDDDAASDLSIMPLASGYVERAKQVMPRQGTRHPWDNPQSIAKDKLALEYASLDDGVLRLS
jgi:cation diffusion facilitator CzcD-associated flavoprotein CzcO